MRHASPSAPGASMQGVLRELGLVLRSEYEELELRVAQLEHRLRLLEREEDLTPPAAPRPRSAGLSAPRAKLSAVATRTKQRNLGRLSEIAQVAVRHGFGYFIEKHKLTDLLPFGQRGAVVPSAANQRGVHLREMLDELGPTFVKFGQVLSTRPDIVPPDIIVELRAPPGRRSAVPVRAGRAGRRDRARALARARVPRLRADADRRRVDRAGAPRDAPERQARRGQGAASGRAAADRGRPRAALPGGAHRQGADPRARLHRRARARRRVRPLDPRELDYRSEGRNAERFRRNWAGDPHVRSRTSTGATRARAC